MTARALAHAARRGAEPLRESTVSGMNPREVASCQAARHLHGVEVAVRAARPPRVGAVQPLGTKLVPQLLSDATAVTVLDQPDESLGHGLLVRVESQPVGGCSALHVQRSSFGIH
jgi:hypothetical protein